MNKMDHDMLNAFMSEDEKKRCIRTMEKELEVSENDISHITIIKKGMTNRSFCFSAGGKNYLMRIPGEGTRRLLHRSEEYAVYKRIENVHISDQVCYMDPVSGYKITVYQEKARVCDVRKEEDVRRCMYLLRSFHQYNIQVDHVFDLFGQISFYESLWEGSDSCYEDFKETKARVWALKKYVEHEKKNWCLTHIDAVSDNFLFYEENGVEQTMLIDWEYAGMQDPHVDIAMFAIYAGYDRKQVDWLIDLYFDGMCDCRTKRKIYCYIAICGLLWSNWCEYKRKLGIEFGQYALRQYAYAKEYCSYLEEEYMAERAIIMAAGKGVRLRPLTEKLPKPMIRVHGRRIIDTIIDGLLANGIWEIYIVIGYKKESFQELLLDYPDVRLIENPYFDMTNNISSLYMARGYLENCIILDGDQIIENPQILYPFFRRSGYCSAWVDKPTTEWLQQVRDGIVVSCSRSGGTCGWQLYGVSFWTKKDGRKLRKLLELEFEQKKNDQIYWDDIAMFNYAGQFQMGIREITKKDIVEIDSYDEWVNENEKKRG